MRNGPSDHVVSRVSGEIDTLRSELGSLVSELDRRRHEAFDLRLQAKRHPIVLAIAATGVAFVVGGLLAVAVRRRSHRRSPTIRARDARAAIARLVQNPRRVGVEPSIASKIATAVGVAVATTLTRRLLDRAVRPVPAR